MHRRLMVLRPSGHSRHNRPQTPLFRVSAPLPPRRRELDSSRLSWHRGCRSKPTTLLRAPGEEAGTRPRPPRDTPRGKSEGDSMSASPPPRHDLDLGEPRRLTTETKSAFKT